MPYLENFDDFYAQSEALYREAPLQTRYASKYRHTDGALILKVTDDKTCLKFKTDQATDLKKLEKLNALFLSLMGKGLTASLDELMAESPAPSSGPRATAGRAQGGKGGQQQQRSKRG